MRALGARGRWFESSLPDKTIPLKQKMEDGNCTGNYASVQRRRFGLRGRYVKSGSHHVHLRDEGKPTLPIPLGETSPHIGGCVRPNAHSSSMRCFFCKSSSVGRASASHAESRGFEPRLLLNNKIRLYKSKEIR